MHLRLDSSCDTLSGYLVERLGHIPVQDELPLTITTEEADYEIESMDERVIRHVKMTLKETRKENTE